MGLSLQNHGLLFSLSLKDCALLVPLGDKNLLTPLPLGSHLLFHGFLNSLGRIDVLYLNSGDFNSPRVSRLIKNASHLRVDYIAAGKCLVKLQLADDVSDCC